MKTRQILPAIALTAMVAAACNSKSPEVSPNNASKGVQPMNAGSKRRIAIYCYMKKPLSLFLALSLVAAITAQAQKKSEKEVTVKGEVVDVACYMMGGAKGDDHKAYAEACAKAGGALGILTADGELYVSLLPDDHKKGPNAVLVDHIAQTERGPYARIAILRPHDGHTVDFEAGYIRHLEWHRQARDTWVWYGWTIWAGDRQRWFVYATFGHSAASLDSPVAPAEDERDNISNVTPHAQYLGNALYEYLPGLSRGTGEPQPTARLEFTTVDLVPGAAKAFEAALSADQSRLQGETLWYRMVAGGTAPRYVRLRPRPSLSAILDGRSEQALPDKVNDLIAKMTVEILNLRPTMSYGLSPARE